MQVHNTMHLGHDYPRMHVLMVIYIQLLSCLVVTVGVHSNHICAQITDGMPILLDQYRMCGKRVISDCVVSPSHSCSGQLQLVEHSPLIKWFLKDWMARSAALTQRLLGSTNWHLTSSFLRYSLIGFVAWLSVTLKLCL